MLGLSPHDFTAILAGAAFIATGLVLGFLACLPE